jgi:hypothetical protein
MNGEHLGDDPRFGLGYALVAYAFLIVTFFAYTGWIHLRCARLQARLEEVSRRLAEAGTARRP